MTILRTRLSVGGVDRPHPAKSSAVSTVWRWAPEASRGHRGWPRCSSHWSSSPPWTPLLEWPAEQPSRQARLAGGSLGRPRAHHAGWHRKRRHVCVRFGTRPAGGVGAPSSREAHKAGIGPAAAPTDLPACPRARRPLRVRGERRRPPLARPGRDPDGLVRAGRTAGPLRRRTRREAGRLPARAAHTSLGVRRLGRGARSPFSNLWLYGHTTPVDQAAEAGLRICLGADWSPSAAKNLLGELKVADLCNRELFGGAFNDEDLCRMATTNPAEALGWSAMLGSLSEGLRADVLVTSTRESDPYRNLISATERGVEFVAINGYPFYGTSKLMKAAGGNPGRADQGGPSDAADRAGLPGLSRGRHDLGAGRKRAGQRARRPQASRAGAKGQPSRRQGSPHPAREVPRRQGQARYANARDHLAARSPTR